MGKTTLFLLTGGSGNSEVEQAVDGAHRAAARDLLETLLPIPSIGLAVVATDDPSWTTTLADLPVEVDLDPVNEPFHFGRRLAELIERYDADRVLYTGGGSAPLLKGNEWARVVDRLGRAKRLVITNNVHSSDWAAFTPSEEACWLIADQVNDNAIAWALAHEAGFPAEDMKASASSRFDIDTPADLLIAHRHPGIGPHLRRHLDRLDWQCPQLDGVLSEMGREGGSLIVAGRASSAAWRSLEESTQCWVRVFAEERGMRASGRQASGAVRSLLADYLDLVGIEGFFEGLGGLANAILLDNRVILAARNLWPSAIDRFHADLYRWHHVDDPFLRRLTRAAADAPVPVVMGGHSVVAGGLMALTEARRAVTPAPDEGSQQ
ncbi:MAG: hypothetical protein R6X31_14325 [Anaerolineae bacterium]